MNASKKRVRRMAGREPERLLVALLDGALTVTVDPGGTMLRASRDVRGVSVGAGTWPVAVGQHLVAADLAAWRAADGRRRLVPTTAGASHAARLRASERPFIAQHQPLDTRPAAPGASVLVNTAESPLAWLRRRPGDRDLIGPAGFEAGERLRRDLTLARTLPRTTAVWDASGVAGTKGPGDRLSAADHVIAARQRVTRALDAVGPELAGLLVDVCGFLKGLQQVEAERRWPPRSAKVALSLGLKTLAAHYGLSDAATGRERAPIRTWAPLSAE